MSNFRETFPGLNYIRITCLLLLLLYIDDYYFLSMVFAMKGKWLLKSWIATKHSRSQLFTHSLKPTVSVPVMQMISLVMLRYGFIDFDRFRFDFSINYSILIRFNSIFLWSAHLCWPYSIRVTLCGRVGTAVLECWPPTKLSPTAATVVGLNREDVEWALQIKQCGIVTRSWNCQAGQRDGTH